MSQRGGAATDYRDSFYAGYIDNHSYSRVLLQHINQAPMFKPFSTNVKVVGTSGVLPTGLHYLRGAARTPTLVAPRCPCHAYATLPAKP